MSVKLNRPPKPEDGQKNSNFNGKPIPYPGFEPVTAGLAVGSHNHCTIWVGREHQHNNTTKFLCTLRPLQILKVNYTVILFSIHFPLQNPFETFLNGF
jgi:hypothetical protein